MLVLGIQLFSCFFLCYYLPLDMVQYFFRFFYMDSSLFFHEIARLIALILTTAEIVYSRRLFTNKMLADL